MTKLRLDLSDIGGGGVKLPSLPGGKCRFPACTRLLCLGWCWTDSEQQTLERWRSSSDGNKVHTHLVRLLLWRSHVPRVPSLRFVIYSQPEPSWFHQKHVLPEEFCSRTGARLFLSSDVLASQCYRANRAQARVLCALKRPSIFTMSSLPHSRWVPDATTLAPAE